MPAIGQSERRPAVQLPGQAMTRDGENGQTALEGDVGPDPAGTVEPAPPDATWLLRHKVGLPDPIEGYVERPEVEGRCALLDRRLTVLHAPGGFGKTALLAHRCRALRERGIAAAWLSLDEEDGPGSVATHLTLAFEQAGLATFGPAGGREEGAGAPSTQGGSSPPRCRRSRRTAAWCARGCGASRSRWCSSTGPARERAQSHLVDYLLLFAETDYVRPLARERAVALALLDDVADAQGADPGVASAAAGLREAMRDDAGGGEDPSHGPLSRGEMDVLALLERHKDKEIAKALNLSYDGVRTRVRGIFAKLGARGRLDAVHRARTQGILPPAEDAPQADS